MFEGLERTPWFNCVTEPPVRDGFYEVRWYEFGDVNRRWWWNGGEGWLLEAVIDGETTLVKSGFGRSSWNEWRGLVEEYK